ncbi:MAG: hypothetical protein R2818_13845 [Flavobacteriales bacterium]
MSSIRSYASWTTSAYACSTAGASWCSKAPIRIGWDGYYRGELSPQDVYVVQTWFRFVDGKQIEKLSDLTLFR